MPRQWKTDQGRQRYLPADWLIATLPRAVRTQSQQHKLEEDHRRLSGLPTYALDGKKGGPHSRLTALTSYTDDHGLSALE